VSLFLRRNADLGDAEGGDVLAVGGGAVPGAPQRRQDAADALHGDAAVYGVSRRRGGAAQAGASVVVPNGLHGGRQDAHRHAQHRGHAHRGHAPLTCGGIHVLADG